MHGRPSESPDLPLAMAHYMERLLEMMWAMHEIQSPVISHAGYLEVTSPCASCLRVLRVSSTFAQKDCLASPSVAQGHLDALNLVSEAR